ncbi:hypothetical protein [Acetobacter sp.]|uniref:hypothetical protein n=1 Tax=Acetobacter sp. TaxID=440 RepID=UPI002584D136|nr:hypothetical protein [Acetobacter sp.]MCC6105935.1 hypothetical protein [Acetobacter sp.]
MTTKLEIIGPYTPEHEGPFCTRGGIPVDLRIRDGRGDYPLAGYIGDNVSLIIWSALGEYVRDNKEHLPDLMNASEVPVAREFWVNEYAGKDGLFHNIFENEATAHRHKADTFLRTIHVREVLPEEGA